MSLYKDFEKLKADKMELADEYEITGNFEMAYVALWSVTEHTVKNVVKCLLIVRLKQAVNEWKIFLDNGQEGRQPKKITNFSTEVKSIPNIKEIEAFLGSSCPNIATLLQTQQKGKSSKFRDRRNDIAHNAVKFGSESKYIEYKQAAIAAIIELEEKLKNNTEA